MAEIHAQENILEKLYSEPKNLWKRLLILAVLLVIVGWGAYGFEIGLDENGVNMAKSIFNGLTHPETELFNLGPKGIPYLILETIAIAFLSTVIGTILAIPVSFLSSTNIVPRPVALIFRAIVLFIRTIPSLVWALIWVRVTSTGPFCGVVTQSVCSIGMISKMNVTAIENLDTGVLEALDACGANTFEKIRVGVLPQLSASFVSTAIYRFDINLKDATLLGIVGAGGIGSPLNDAIGNMRWNRVGAFLIVLIVMVVIIEFVSTRIRARLAQGRR
ncbi:MAG: phosphonate ABC transporter, permease protein PhnE [Lachnospiraceae bacterium]|nr:phosphonate ABC transporter, permease protein PhnE [Lachnospiraceae bacterium]MBQ9616603.1 phosphonate ABC transporter, permease protein PhnE [Selenomonadaceae bacterium]